MTGPVLLIGVGAEDRGDDAAGLLVARRVRASAPAGVEVVESAGDAGELLSLLDGAERVVLVDAAMGGPAGAVELVPPGAAHCAPARSTHGLGVAEALELAAALGSRPPVVRLYVVHGAAFEPGPVSPAVDAGVRVAAERILRDELGR
ncbi:MAG TPA: hydrogenase maturation protease [Candidatus Dormibacteraeota bacterium]|nr:hydrogenase maturation protease [Candidatus Dormibacteraeota bacterium]